MLAMQPSVWLPENLEPNASRHAIILTTALSGLFCSASVLWMTGLKEGPAFWVVALLCTGLIVLAMHLQWRGRQARRGWVVDFQQGSLTPVGLAQRERIQMDPAQYSLGCYPAATRETGATFLLELRHVRRGPVAALTLVHLTSRQFQRNLRILDRCVNTLAERLRIRRSGAPLLAGSDVPHAR
jgi:hypothetical protein